MGNFPQLLLFPRVVADSHLVMLYLESSNNDSMRLEQMKDVSYSIRQLKAKKKHRHSSEDESLSLIDSTYNNAKKKSEKEKRKSKLRVDGTSYYILSF